MLTASPIVQPMTATEARVCVQRIRAGIGTIRACLVELRDRKGWKALAYTSLRECVLAEFGIEKSQLYEELQSAEVEENLTKNSGIPEKPSGWLPGSQARVLADLEPEQQRNVYLAATLEKGENVTAQDLLDKKIEVIFNQLSPEKQKEIIEAEERDVQAKTEPRTSPESTKFTKIQGYLGKILTNAAKLETTAAKFGEADPVMEEIRAGLAHFHRAQEMLPGLGAGS